MNMLISCIIFSTVPPNCHPRSGCRDLRSRKPAREHAAFQLGLSLSLSEAGIKCANWDTHPRRRE